MRPHASQQAHLGPLAKRFETEPPAGQRPISERPGPAAPLRIRRRTAEPLPVRARLRLLNLLADFANRAAAATTEVNGQNRHRNGFDRPRWRTLNPMVSLGRTPPIALSVEPDSPALLNPIGLCKTLEMMAILSDWCILRSVLSPLTWRER